MKLFIKVLTSPLKSLDRQSELKFVHLSFRQWEFVQKLMPDVPLLLWINMKKKKKKRTRSSLARRSALPTTHWYVTHFRHWRHFSSLLGGSGGIRTHASEETGALNQRLRPLGHATYMCWLWISYGKIHSVQRIFSTSQSATSIQVSVAQSVSAFGC